MENALMVASYFCNRYFQAYGQRIDEMKLHKLMYFAQREALIQRDQPLFAEEFRGWKYGPVLECLRDPYKEDRFLSNIPRDALQQIRPIADPVFDDYAGRDSWALARLSHDEISWKNSRRGVAPGDHSNNPMTLEDICLDAERIRHRRKMLEQLL